MTRGKGEHSIYQRSTDGRWVAAITLPSHNGDRRRRVLTNSDKKALLAELAVELKALSSRGDLPTANMTVAEWLDYWLREIAGKETRPKTMANYRSFVKNHIAPPIGHVRLNKLSPDDVRKVDNLVAAKFSSSTAATAHRIMSSSFAAAEREGRIGRNPAELVKTPRIAPSQLEVLTVEEFVRLIELFRDSPERYLWATYMLTGTRRGEILGLEWDRVTDVLDLSWQLQRLPVDLKAPTDYEYRRLMGGLYLTRPKTNAGWRLIPLVSPLKEILVHWRQEWTPNEHNLVFATRKGTPFGPEYISRLWPKTLSNAGIQKKVRLHDLRHTAVDMMYHAGVGEAMIQEIVGHSTRAMTRGYRSRGNRPQLEHAMTQFSSLLGVDVSGHV